MAERRMFSGKIICSDAFCGMPFSAQALYVQLCMEADDDGFLNNAKRIQKMLEASPNDLNLLFENRFILGFANGVIVIKHWRVHNLIRKDRYNPTQYQDEFALLEIKPDGAYTEKAVDGETETVATTWQPNNNQMATQDRLGKDSIGKVIDILSDSDESDNTEIYKTIIEYLNKKAGTKYRASSKKTKSCIHARLAEGFTLEDFKTVIDKKCEEWIGTEYEQYLRPETLFGTKFESYLNAKVRKPGKNKPLPTAKGRKRSYDMEAYERMTRTHRPKIPTAGDDP